MSMPELLFLGLLGLSSNVGDWLRAFGINGLVEVDP
jgi:hypothetical protein